AVGALARYGLTMGLMRLCGRAFPFGTFAANVIGCLLIGLVMGAALAGGGPSERVRIAVAVGLLGGLTTFSSFGFDTVQLLQSGRIGVALANVAANLAVGLFAVAVGLRLARSFVASG
ncbi:MAG: fluoride efflux transporter CrcB, partial [Planctomycetota bacterium]